MRRKKFHLIALVLIVLWASATFARVISTRPRQTSDKSVRTRTVPEGQAITISGIVIKRDSDSFTLREPFITTCRTV